MAGNETITKHEIERDFEGISEDIKLEISSCPDDRLPALADLIEKIGKLADQFRVTH